MTSVLGLHELTLEESRALLGEYRISTPHEVTASTVDDVVHAARGFGSPFVVKLIAPGLTHKSDVGGVALGVEGPERARDAAVEMLARVPNATGFLLQELITAPIELIVGLRRDPALGAFVVVGVGGIWVEVLDDVAIRPVPVGPDDAEAMLRELRAAPLLEGRRGSAPVDRRAAAGVVEAVSRLALDHPDIEQVDLNPVLVQGDRAVAVDRHVVRRSPPARHRRPSSRAGIKAMLEPDGIVVVGASANTDKVGGRLFRYLIDHGYTYPVYPVNATAEPVMGMTAYRSVSELPTVPDLACVVVPGPSVLSVVRSCVDVGIPAITVYSAGFAEAGSSGRSLQDELARFADESRARIGGPNTAGMVNTHWDMCASITMAFEDERMTRGNIGVVTQSGGLGSALLSRIWDAGAGISTWVSCGNEVDVTMSDYLECLVDDPHTDVLVLFIEAIRDRDAFAVACRRARQLGKPVLAYKTGTTAAGRAAVLSHTAALAGDDRLYDSLFRSLGVVRCTELEELLDAALALAWQPRLRGRRVAVVSTSGGACSIAADACLRVGLELPAFSAESTRRIRGAVPSFGFRDNPVDVTLGASTRPDVVGEVIDAVIDEPNVDAVLVVLTSNTGAPASRMATQIAAIGERVDKPIVVARIAAEYLAPDAMARYRAARVPVYPTPERAIAVLAAMARAGGVDAAPRVSSGAT